MSSWSWSRAPWRPVWWSLEDRLYAAVHAPIQVGSLDLHVGVSIGVAAASRGLADAASLLAEADRRMYAAKRHPGR